MVPCLPRTVCGSRERVFFFLPSTAPTNWPKKTHKPQKHFPRVAASFVPPSKPNGRMQISTWVLPSPMRQNNSLLGHLRVCTHGLPPYTYFQPNACARFVASTYVHKQRLFVVTKTIKVKPKSQRLTVMRQEANAHPQVRRATMQS